ncbi:MAG: BMP family ABC transporter substrate-binding protein [Clostridia bacterium]|nr:BMP family ABC transporter substrate-binding protein [Clostridia bacterium]
MKKKIFNLLAALLLIFTCAFVFTACGVQQNAENSNDQAVWDVDTVYAEARSLGYSGTLEEFLDTVKGKDGVGISSAFLNIDGELILVLTDASTKNLGKIVGEKGDNGLSAYEIYKKYHPEYTGTEEDWINDLVNGRLAGSSDDDEQNEENVPMIALLTLHNEVATYDKNYIDAFKQAAANKGLQNSDYRIITGIPESETCYNEAVKLSASGCKAIFADSFGHDEYMKRAAKKYANTQFYCATGFGSTVDDCPDNFHNAYASIYEGRYLAGYAAGLKLNTMKDKADESNNFNVGYVGAYCYAEVVSDYTAWFLGLQAALDEGYTATMEVIFTGSWYDEVGEKAAAEMLIERGCVLISQHADSMGAPTACESAGVLNVAYNYDTDKSTLVAYSKINWVPFFEMMIDSALGGAPVAKNWTGSLATGSVICELGPAAADGTADKLAEIKNRLIAGTRKVFDCSTFTVTVVNEPDYFASNMQCATDSNGHLIACYADVISDPAYTRETNVILTENGITYYAECMYRSAPYFDVFIDRIVLLNLIF